MDVSLDPLDVSSWSNLTVRFFPDSSGLKTNKVIIQSNDPDEPEVEIELAGHGIAPMIQLTPMWYDFGQPYVGCMDWVDVLVENIGTSDLEVSDIIFSSTADMSLDLTAGGNFPWIVPPGNSVPLRVDYLAMDENYDIGYVNVDSNDPLIPTITAIQEGDAQIAGTITDEFIQDETIKSDILFVIDNSCSMGEEQANVALNADTFITFLEGSGADFQIAVITTDDYTFRGPIITPTTPDVVGEFATQIVAGVMGSATETGLEMAYKVTSPGQAAGPGSVFLRPDAIFSLVFISDEDDFSPQPVPNYITHFLALKTNPADVLVHAVAGQIPTTCAYASAAYRYFDVVASTAGLFLDICVPDWGRCFGNAC